MFLVPGRAAPRLLRQRSESLAGRVANYAIPGISLSETGPGELNRLWLRGGFPPSLTAPSDEDSYLWRTHFIRTFLERDVPQFGINIPSVTLDRFWAMLSHYHGQVWNGSELARAFGVAHHAVRRYLSVLESTYIVRALKPWAANLKKRQVKSPKIYLRDTGILHQYLGISTRRDLERHPKIGASWEGFVIEAAIQSLGLDDRQCYFWATHGGAEIDLVVQHGTQLRGIEVKRTSSPSLTPSMKTALSDFGLSRIDVIHAGGETYPLARDVRAVAAVRLLDDL